MDEKIITLIQGLAGSAETLVAWYMVLVAFKTLLGELASVAIAWVITTAIYRVGKLFRDSHLDDLKARYGSDRFK